MSFQSNAGRSNAGPSRQRGLALIIALVLLMVMTLVAVVAMRSTTLDLKMTTNMALARRAFQASEAGRNVLGPVIDAHVFNRGWPDDIDGGTVDASADFPLPTEVEVFMGGRSDPGTYRIYLGENGCLYADTVACTEFAQQADGATRRDADLRFRAEVASGTLGDLDPNEIFADVWLTRTASLPAPGSGAAQGSGYLGPGVGSAGAGAHVYIDIRSEGEVIGNANARTGSDYRVLVRN